MRITFLRNGLTNRQELQKRISIVRKINGVNHDFRLPVVDAPGRSLTREDAFPGYSRDDFRSKSVDSLHSGDYSASPSGARAAYVNTSVDIDKTPGYLQAAVPPRDLLYLFAAEIERTDGTRSFESFTLLKTRWTPVANSPFSTVSFGHANAITSSTMFNEAWGKFTNEL